MKGDGETMYKKVPLYAMLVALAMIFSYVEALLPISFGVPGMKLGLANLIVVIGLYLLKPGEVLLISVLRIVLVGYLFGNGMSIVYSLAGGLLSFVLMALLRKIKGFSMIGVSIAGGVSHNVGQLLVAAFVLESGAVFYYAPVLLIAGLVTGTLIGIAAGRIVKAVKKGSRQLFD